MTKAYIVMYSTGAYDDYCQCRLGVFFKNSDAVDAQNSFNLQLKADEKKCNDFITKEYADTKAGREEEYADQTFYYDVDEKGTAWIEEINIH